MAGEPWEMTAVLSVFRSFWEQHQEQAGNSSENNFILRVCWGQKCIGKIEMKELITVSITLLQQLSDVTWKLLESCHLLCVLFPSGRFEGWEENPNRAIKTGACYGKEEWLLCRTFKGIFPCQTQGLGQILIQWSKHWSAQVCGVAARIEVSAVVHRAVCARCRSLQEKAQCSSS